MLEVHNLSFSIGNKVLLNNISFVANPGEILVIAGPNGAGKSTLLKTLSDKNTRVKGSVFINKKNINDLRSEDLATKRAVLSQSFASVLNYKVQEIIMMGRYPHYKEFPSEQDLQIVNEVLHTLDITHLAHRDYTTLSGGEQQRVQFARVLSQIWVTEPMSHLDAKYLFLDEPVSSLDLYQQQMVLEVSQQMAFKGVGVIAVLHDINLIAQYADKVLLLNKGAVAAIGTPDYVFTQDRIKEVYGIDVQILEDNNTEQLLILPILNNKKIKIKQYDNHSININ